MPNRPSRKMSKPNGLLAMLLDAAHERAQEQKMLDAAKEELDAPPAPYAVKVTQSPGSHLPPGWGE